MWSVVGMGLWRSLNRLDGIGIGFVDVACCGVDGLDGLGGQIIEVSLWLPNHAIYFAL